MRITMQDYILGVASFIPLWLIAYIGVAISEMLEDSTWRPRRPSAKFPVQLSSTILCFVHLMSGIIKGLIDVFDRGEPFLDSIWISLKVIGGVVFALEIVVLVFALLSTLLPFGTEEPRKADQPARDKSKKPKRSGLTNIDPNDSSVQALNYLRGVDQQQERDQLVAKLRSAVEEWQRERNDLAAKETKQRLTRETEGRSSSPFEAVGKEDGIFEEFVQHQSASHNRKSEKRST